jgi:hypothetical protein
MQPAIGRAKFSDRIETRLVKRCQRVFAKVAIETALRPAWFITFVRRGAANGPMVQASVPYLVGTIGFGRWSPSHTQAVTASGKR